MVGLVVILVVVLVVVKVTGGGNGSGSIVQGPTDTPAQASVVSAVTSIPQSTFDANPTPPTAATTINGTPAASPPSVVSGQSHLTLPGSSLPAALFIGAEYCPYCAAERWAVIAAFNRFGTFSNLLETRSSPWDNAGPNIPTFSFKDATYTSQYIHLVMVEHQANATGPTSTAAQLEPLTSQEDNLWGKYENGQKGYPFMDIDNQVIVMGPTYLPKVLAGLDHHQVAAKLSNPNDLVTQAIAGAANQITAGICKATNQQPSTVCSSKGVTEAARSLAKG